MARLTANVKSGFLRQINQGAIASNLTLLEALLAFQTGVFSQSFQQGKIVTSTSGNGQSASFINVPDYLLGSQGEIFDMSEELIKLLGATCDSQSLDPSQVDQNQTIFDAMVLDASLLGVRSAQNDWTILGWPQVGGGVGQA